MAHSDEILNCDKNRNELFLSGRGLQWFYLICNSVTVSSICLIVMQVLRQLQRRGIYFRVDKSLVYEGKSDRELKCQTFTLSFHLSACSRSMHEKMPICLFFCNDIYKLHLYTACILGCRHTERDCEVFYCLCS